MRLHRRERPAVAGELARDRDSDDRASFAAVLECVPALVEAACARVGARANSGRLVSPAALERGARP